MSLQEALLFELPRQPKHIEIVRSKADAEFDMKRRSAVEERTGQITMNAPGIGFIALGEFYRILSSPGKRKNAVNEGLDDPIHPGQLVLSELN